MIRYQLYVAIQSNSKRRLEPKDILELPWDNRAEKWDDEKEEKMVEDMKVYEDMLNDGRLDFKKVNPLSGLQILTNTPNNN